MRTQNRRAFSLVEVLISIVVLALGLLGIAAVFPAVVGQQRQATDSVLSASVQESVTHYLRENSVLNKASTSGLNQYLPVLIPDNQQRGWQLLTGNSSWSPPVSLASSLPIFNGDWCTINPDLNTVGLCLETGSGKMKVIGHENNLAPDTTGNYQQTFFDIPLAQRLSPTPYNSSAQPLYVWDFVARRIGAGNAADNTGTTDVFKYTLQDDSVQVAVFVRRIDSGIRKPPGVSIADVLSGNVTNASDRRVPVAEDPVSGRPTFDGLGGATPVYSGIHSIKYSFPTGAPPASTRHDHPPGSYIVLDSTNTLRAYAQQTGQKLVDCFGVVHTITPFLYRDPAPADPEWPDPNAVYEITPPIDVASDVNWCANAPSANAPHLMFTTQVPAAVFVVTVPTPIPGSTN